jgi:multiple sugar transport system permease protein
MKRGYGTRSTPIQSLWQGRWGYFFIAPAVISITLFAYYPLVNCFVYSFQNHRIDGTSWVGLANFNYTLTDGIFWKTMANTLVYTLGVVPVSIFLGLLLSALVFGQKTKVQAFFKGAYYLPGVVSAVIVGLIWSWLFFPDQQGIFNYFLSFLGFEEPIRWLGEKSTAMPSLIFMTVMGGPGMSIILFTAAMGNIPTSLYESARLEGATAWQEFRHITLPLLRPVLLYLLVMTTITSFNVFEYIYTMTRGGPANSTKTIVYLIYETAFQEVDFGVACAQAMILFVILIVISIIQFKWLSSDVEF